jgi:diguanylate cyclase (GGDEF)-like protein/PAS domain S-box-containing protein
MQPPFEQLVGLLRDVVIVTEAAPLDGEGPRIEYVNPAFSRLTGYRADEVVGRSVCMLRGARTDADVIARMRASLQRGETVREVVLNYCKDGSTCWMDLSVNPMRDAAGRITHFAAIERDISAHKALERRLQQSSGIDPLTGMLARREFFQRAEAACAQTLSEGRSFGVMMLDIDHFRSINGTHGHDLGDELLVQVATAIRGAIRSVDLAGRIAGDEFAIALPSVEPDQAYAIAQQVRAAIRRMRLPGLPWLAMTASFGVACSERGNDRLAILLARAERACDEARRGGRNRVSIDRVYGRVIPFRPRPKTAAISARTEASMLLE